MAKKRQVPKDITCYCCGKIYPPTSNAVKKNDQTSYHDSREDYRCIDHDACIKRRLTKNKSKSLLN